MTAPADDISDDVPATVNDAFPLLSDREMRIVASLGARRTFADGEALFRAGDGRLDFIVVEAGRVEVLNPSDGGRHVAWHDARHFAGDVDLLTGRPVVVDALARGPVVALRVPAERFRQLLNTVPSLSDKLLVAIQARRTQLESASRVGLQIVGGSGCAHTTLVREFLHKNFVPHNWHEPDSGPGRAVLSDCGMDADACVAGDDQHLPAIRFGSGDVLRCPTLREVAERTGVWQGCPTDTYDLAIVGAGPSGMAAAVYAASEGLSTIVVDRLGPGGQAGDSSKIENFIGFPSGLSGTELATRAVLQMFKFGARLLTPVDVTALEPARSADEPHRLRLSCGAAIAARTVLVAVGVKWRKIGARGARRFEKRGIYYACTSVESDMHAGQDVAVVGGGNSAGQAAMFLAERCERTVHLLLRGTDINKGMSNYLSRRVEQTKNVKVHLDCEVEEVIGRERLEQLRTKDGGTLDVGALFVFIGSDPHADWLPDDVCRDKAGYLLTGTDMLSAGHWPLKDRAPCALETSIPRVLAGGDARKGSTKRVGFAVGDGSLAVTCAHALRAND